MNFKEIHIGNLISLRVTECGVEMPRICSFMRCSEQEVQQMYLRENLTTDTLLKWSKLLEYDFFRLYTQHLILYSPPSKVEKTKESLISPPQPTPRKDMKTSLPKFRKNIYTREIIEFILESVQSGEKTRQQVIYQYRIPKTTLYKWLSKYGKK